MSITIDELQTLGFENIGDNEVYTAICYYNIEHDIVIEDQGDSSKGHEFYHDNELLETIDDVLIMINQTTINKTL